ncbi:hypothetical protein [Flammeovirga kamogawensis]|uniref:DUF4783 domain-containing protein n=1 Tax=Flammeovirga kamogawensis TaxID=373891 RepID=A0ABX8GZJ2_9BACT|nr:hypothetical protein [Flammeovirga kamogawensis]MBB6459212.1 hypothetical protein [Flammeovirga kamogawensis]QWG08777.1 hypothetical protein KM029_07500 [Flammeovirga kamogawensis]TRX67067.1 hypothetical protein EO216_02545 [Flammeovirga kamogawensis]
MKTVASLITVAFLFAYSNSAYAVEVEKITETHLNEIKGNVFSGKGAELLLEDYVGLFKDKKSIFLYHTESEDLVAQFKSGIRTVELYETIITNQMTNVYFKINGDVLVHVSYLNTSGEMYKCRLRQEEQLASDLTEASN